MLDGPMCLGTIGGAAPAPAARDRRSRADRRRRRPVDRGAQVQPHRDQPSAATSRPNGSRRRCSRSRASPRPGLWRWPAVPACAARRRHPRMPISMPRSPPPTPTLPAYARVASWREVAHFTPPNGRLTGNGRLRPRGDRAPPTSTARRRSSPRSRPRPVRERLRVPRHPAGPRRAAGTIAREAYVAYLAQAYHHVRHTVPLMQEARAAAGAPARRWSPRSTTTSPRRPGTRNGSWPTSPPPAAMPTLCAPARRTPRPRRWSITPMPAFAPAIRSAFFGMVYVLESVSVALASRGAGAIQQRLGLPPQAFTYLTSHGALDQSHMRVLRTAW